MGFYNRDGFFIIAIGLMVFYTKIFSFVKITVYHLMYRKCILLTARLLDMIVEDTYLRCETARIATATSPKMDDERANRRST